METEFLKLKHKYETLMENLKEYAIVETFDGLDRTKQKALLEKLVAKADLISVTIKFENDHYEGFYRFLCKTGKFVTLTFFHESLRRWEILKKRSYAFDCSIAYFHIYSENVDSGRIPFTDEKHKHRVFYDDIIRGHFYRDVYISKIRFIYPVIGLMDLSVEDFDAKMIEYGFLIRE